MGAYVLVYADEGFKFYRLQELERGGEIASSLPQWYTHHWGFIVELCCPFYVCSNYIFEIIPVWSVCLFLSFWLKAISKTL